ncbi:MAG: ABC transporter ATP-binding protein/permease [Candidatus Izemoplasmatales bacterium]|jgi:ABC-type lipoprotein export system ATPase subunit/ABC-type antimicrobial peptide transport system permease subunit|nr:ABC transporter ATP-binding protein/permease [Candidatus Izemoplasmatales bacterium]
MIRLINVNKYFNKGRNNQIHVIKNTSIDFPKTGLVALTGPSGCGKTTLLNVIGGLDGFNSGEIIFDDQTIRKYNPLKWDMLRNEKVGYIFQNYNLVSSKTVYENIELALNMAGLYDKGEIEERINYILESVGMYNFRRRNVKALSGGQQQRVAIARALAKNPEVILADEPTGNLDTNNTFEIMSIIKKISETKLVILVTHEKNLVDFYADRVIELLDGEIVNDYQNSGDKSLNHIDERNIYLKDLNIDEEYKNSGIEYYYDKEKDQDLKIKLIEVKGNIYVKVNSKRKVKYLDDSSEINLIDDHFKKRETKDISDFDFDLSNLKEIKPDQKRKSFIKWSQSLKNGFLRIFSRKKLGKKILLLGYILISAVLVNQLATYGNAAIGDERDYLFLPNEVMMIEPSNEVNVETMDKLINDIEGVELSPYFYPAYVNLFYQDFYQGEATVGMSAYPVKLSYFNQYYDDVDVINGRLPEKSYEITLDEWIASEMIENKQLKDLNVTSVDELIGFTISNSKGMNFEIVGIIKTESPIVVLSDEAIFAFSNVYDFYYKDGEEINSVITSGEVVDRIEIVEGRDILNDNEILVSSNDDRNIGDTILLSSLFGAKTIVGKYEALDHEYAYTKEKMIIGNEDYFDAMKSAMLDEERNYWGYVIFYVDNQEEAVEDFAAEGVELVNSYDFMREQFNLENIAINGFKIGPIVVTIIGLIVFIFFMMRSTMLNRIKEIGIYRSIGATKRDIYKIFVSEIIALTIVGSMSGYFFMSYIVYQLQNAGGEFLQMYYFPFYLFIGGLIGIFVLNILFGMLPIFTLLRKKPAEILAKYDI